MRKGWAIIAVSMVAATGGCNNRTDTFPGERLTFDRPAETVQVKREVRTHTLPYLLSGEGGSRANAITFLPTGVQIRPDGSRVRIVYPVIRCRDAGFCLDFFGPFDRCDGVIVPGRHREKFEIDTPGAARPANCRRATRQTHLDVE